MKKLSVVVMAVVMVLALCLNVGAAGWFVKSPSGNDAPIIIEFENEDPNCTASLTIIPYKDRVTLTDEEREEMEDAYDDIVNADDLGELCDALEKLADLAGVSIIDLAVSDLFYIDMDNCDVHYEHGKFKIKLDADTLKGFVGLMQMIDGEWVLVEDAVIDENGYLVFSADELGSFAVVVDKTKNDTTSPQTGDPTMEIAVYSSTAVVMLAAFAAVVAYKKKRV